MLGGDKSDDWAGWYTRSIPIADDRFEKHQQALGAKASRREEETMSMKSWEKKVLAKPGAAARVAEIEDELRLAAGLTALREQAGLSQRDLAKRLGVSQPRIAAIERSKNVTVDLLEQYVEAVGGGLQLTVVKGNKRIELGSPRESNWHEDLIAGGEKTARRRGRPVRCRPSASRSLP